VRELLFRDNRMYAGWNGVRTGYSNLCAIALWGICARYIRVFVVLCRKPQFLLCYALV
jgi:hypothetical protein